jgi:hypothetical protein
MLASLVAATLGCAIRTERVGSDHLLNASFAWGDARITAQEAAHALGLPDEIQSDGAGLRFIYRFERRRRTGFVLSYVLKFLTRESSVAQARRLVLRFDQNDRLLDYQLFAPLPAGAFGGRPARR